MAHFAMKEDEFCIIDDPKEANRRGTTSEKNESDIVIERSKSMKENTRTDTNHYQQENPLQHQLNVIEEWIDESLFTFLCAQDCFEFLNNAIPLAQKAVDVEFADKFDKIKIQERVYAAETKEVNATEHK